ncbi:hypothetical protein MKW98_018526 [Papaver atlanticum]|uniref:Micro-fibrillar-associated protein 1 C-terminal domain-containing protein n=1 Tax=Papaver atlanticum TaxID=357466 RepID=A0AAD4TG90_9MAGN|nr:hypothetical protein MKW98_018526 [Papaver atlanticum]
MSVTAGVSDTIIAIRDKLRGRIGQTKVKRYWPGKAPEWANEAEEEGDIRTARDVALEKAFPTRDDSDVVRRDDPRLRRLAESKIDNRDEIRADHRRIRQAEIVSTIEEENRRQEGLDLEEEDEDAQEERRRKIREKLLQREQEEAALLHVEEEDEPQESEDEESEYETDSEEELTGIAMIKPVFVPKAERDTIAERERLEAEEQKLEDMVRRRKEERKVETKQIVVAEIQKDEQIQKNLEAEANIEDVDTDDEVNEAEEYEAWKVREISRIKRDREDRDSMVKEKEEIERLRNMTEEERREWERKNPKTTDSKVNKQKWRFMQKYYHKGAFFQDDADDPAGTARADKIYTRDFSKPTGEDNMDKTILPKVMQVKHFGRSGRTKWTHLVNEDTTSWDNPWANNDTLRAKYNSKMAGMDAPIAKPRGSKKLKDWELPNNFQGDLASENCGNSFFPMAEEEVAAKSVIQQSPPPNPPPFLEVTCASSGKVRRFAIGTESKFALYLINFKLDIGVSHASYIEAVKEGEESINFGPNALLTDYGHGWKLQTVSEQEVPRKDMGCQPMYKKNPTAMKSDGSAPTKSTMDSSDSHTTYQYFGRIFLALVLLFLLGCTFTVALENLPRLILFITSTM